MNIPTEEKGLTVDELVNLLRGFQKSGMGDLPIIHSFNTIHGAAVVNIDEVKCLWLQGNEQA